MHWYVVQTKPRSEALAIENLQRQGYTAYCPWLTQRKRRRSRWQDVTEPLFPRYVFVQLREGVDDFAPIRSTIGVIGLVRFGGVPATISAATIGFIVEQEKQLLEPDKKATIDWKPGTQLEILDGPMAGLKGVFQKLQGEERVIILLELLGKQSRLAIATNLVAPAE